jgi:hypothetical protein
MKEKDQGVRGGSKTMDYADMDRRIGVGLFGLVILGLCVCFAAGQEQGDERALEEALQRRREAAQEAGRQAQEEAFQRSLERSPNLRAFYEQMGRGGNIQDSMKAMQDWQRQQSLMNLKNQLAVSDEEWKVIQPRLERVYLLRHPPGSVTNEDTSASAMATRLTKELWELLNNKEAKAEEIQVKLTALRNAKEKVRQELTKAKQELRKLMTVRQEAVLVLSDLLD